MNGVEIISSLTGGRNPDQGVAFGEFGRGTRRRVAASACTDLPNMCLYIIVLRGRMRVVMDGAVHLCTARRGNLVAVRSAAAVADMRLSGDFRGFALALSRRFMDECGKTTPVYGGMAALPIHAVTISGSDAQTIADYCRLIEMNRDPNENPLDRSIFRFTVQLCYLKILRQMIHIKQSRSADVHPESAPSQMNATRASMLCARFFGLVERHIEIERRVGFYADALSITPHYLTRITNEYVGLPANRIIADELASRACCLLRNPEYTLQQIADRLCFHDQSSFGRFFRKHTGKTPAAYRKASNLTLSDRYGSSVLRLP